MSTPTEIGQMLRSGQAEQALSATQQALKAAPRDCRLLTLQGIALNTLSRPAESLGVFRRALAICPDYLAALEGAAQLEYAAHDAGAIPLLLRILKAEPGSTTAEAMLATAYRQRGNCAAALPYFERSSPMFAAQPALLAGYGSCLAQTGRSAAALGAYRQLLKVSDTPDTRYDVALLEQKTGDGKAALATLGPLLTDGSDAQALVLGSKLAEAQGNTPDAVKWLRAAIVLQPDTVDHYLDFAQLAFSHRSFQVGIDMVNAGLERMPKAAELYIARGVLETQISQTKAAIEDFRRAHELAPRLSLASDAKGILESQMHDNSQSLETFRSAARAHPKDALLQYLLAEQLSQAQGRAEATAEAITAAQASVRLDPDYVPARDLLASLYVRDGKLKLAVAEAAAALAKDPNDQAALYQEILARRHSATPEEMHALTARLNAIRQRQREAGNRFVLKDDMTH